MLDRTLTRVGEVAVQHRRGLEFKPMAGWPTGFWQAAPLLHTHLVVLRDLPETRESLLLRLHGRDDTYRQAIHELRALPDDEWENALGLAQLLLAYSDRNSPDFRGGRHAHVLRGPVASHL